MSGATSDATSVSLGGLAFDNTTAATGKHKFKAGGGILAVESLTTAGLSDLKLIDVPLLASNTWHTVNLEAVGNKFTLWISGQEVTVFRDDESRLRQGRSARRPGQAPRLRPGSAAQRMRAATSAPAIQWPRWDASRAAAMPVSVAPATLDLPMPALTAAATAAAPASATDVLCVTRLALTTRSISPAANAMPTGVILIAAPFVSPCLGLPPGAFQHRGQRGAPRGAEEVEETALGHVEFQADQGRRPACQGRARPGS